MKTILTKFTTLAIAVLAAMGVQAAKVISIDLQSAKVSGGDMSGETAYGLVPVPGTAWTNDGCSYANNGANKDEDLAVRVKEYDTEAATTTELAADVVLHMKVNNAYYWTTATDPFLKAYADDSAQPIITLKNVPYSKYTVIVYCATDTDDRQFGPVTVNGTPYKYDAETGKAVVASGSTSTEATRWGQCHSLTAVEGTNAIRITGQAGKSVVVMGGTNANGARGGLAAIQIIEEEAVVANVNGGSAYSTADLPAEADVINLTMDADGVITVAAAMTRTVNVISAGSVKIVAGAGYALTVADLAKFDISGISGSAIRVIDTAAIPEGLTAPTAGWTYRYEGETVLTALPFNTDASFAGTVEIACPVESKDGDAWVTLPVHNNKNYVFAEGAAIEANNFQTGNGSGSVQSYVQNGGAITVNSDDNGNSTSAAFLLAHWGNGCTVSYTLNDGSISVPNGGMRVGWDGQGIMTQNGGTVSVKGLVTSRQGRPHESKYYLNGGTLTLGAFGVDFGPTGKIILGGGKIVASETATMTIDDGLSIAVDTTFEVAEGKTLTVNTVLSGGHDFVKTGAGTLIVSEVPNGYTGAIRVNAGALDAQGNRKLQNIVFAEGTKLIAHETTADDGVIHITGITGDPTIELYDALGNAIPAESIERGEGYVRATFTPTVAGKGCWMDYEFKGSLESVGSDTTALTRDGSDFGGDVSSDFKTDESGSAYALYTGTHPYRGVTYPTEWSCAIYCSMPDYAKAALITFGTQSGGLIGLISGTEKDQVLLVRTTGNSAYEVLATMAVPNAATAQHLYVFSKTALEIKVYLDGKLWTTYTATSDISFGGGMQIASVHGGVGSTGIVRFDKVLFNNDIENATLRQSLIGMMRLYNAVLGPNAAKALSDEFPYVSPNGLFTRTVSANGTWSETDAWTKVQESGDVAATVPEDGAMVKLTASAEATVAVNLDAALKTEELVIDGIAALAFTRPQAGKVANSGATTINTAVTIANQAFDLAGGPLTLGENGSICFDFTDYPFNTVLEPTAVALTGMTANQGEKVSEVIPATLPKGRTANVVYDAASQTYQLKIGFKRAPGAIYMPEGETTVTDNMTYADVNGDETLIYSDEDWIVINREIELTIGEDLTRPAKIKVVDGGVLKLYFASGVTKTGNAYNATVRVEEGGVYDIANANGHKDYSHPIILAGGTLTNSGIATTVDARQYWQMSVEAPSTIAVTNNEFGAVNSGWAAHDYVLNGNTLVKTGAGQYTFRTANFVGGGTLQVDEGTLILHACTVPEGATLNFVVADGAQIIVRGNALAKTGTVTGAGTVIYEKGVTTAAIYQDDGWTGTIWIKNMVWNGWDLGRDGKIDTSKVKLTGVKGYSTGEGCNAEVVLQDEDNVKALLATNGSSSAAYFFKKVSGSGTFGWDVDDASITAGPTGGHIYWLKDVADYTGKLVTGNYLMFKIGATAENGRTAGAIWVADGATICPGNWSAKSIEFGRTLKVKGNRKAVLATVTEAPNVGNVKVTLVDADGNETTGYGLKTRAVQGGHEVYMAMKTFTFIIK